MSKQLAGMAIIGLVFGVSAKAEPIEGGKDTAPEGIHRKAGTRLRVVCYNAYWTSIFPRDDGELRSSQWMDGKGMDGEARLSRFAGWAPKAQADIWAMQEVIYSEQDQKDTTADGIAGYFEEITGQDWHVAADGRGRLVLSRHPILWSGPVRNARGMAALVDLPEDFGDDLLVINLHFFTKPPEVQIKQATKALDFIESVRRGEHPEIPQKTPIMICGDFNSLPGDRPYQILAKRHRDAHDGDDKEAQFHTAMPRQLNSEARGTFGEVSWSGEVGASIPHGPTRTIDHILMPRDFLEIQQTFVFNSLILPKEDLARYGVEREAVLLHREGKHEKVDHLPVFVDLK